VTSAKEDVYHLLELHVVFASEIFFEQYKPQSVLSCIPFPVSSVGVLHGVSQKEISITVVKYRKDICFYSRLYIRILLKDLVQLIA